MALTALITRPEDDAEPLAAALAERGIAAIRDPLLTIRALPSARIELSGLQALLFTSANGVRAFAQLSSDRGLPAYCVGDATANAARREGFAQVESAGGNVEDLARLVREKLKPQAGALFHAAGSAVAGDLAKLLGEAGFELRRQAIYESKPAEKLSAETETKLVQGEIDLVLLFSPRTAQNFVALVGGAGDAARQGLKKAEAICLSAAVADAARPLPWKTLRIAARPELPALLAILDEAKAAHDTLAAPSIDRTSAAARAASAAPSSPTPDAAAIEAALKKIAPPRRRSGWRWLLVLIAIVALAFLSRDQWWPWAKGYLPALAGNEPVAVDDGQPAEAAAPAGDTPATAANDPATEALLTRLAALEGRVGSVEFTLGALQGAEPWRQPFLDLQAKVAQLEATLGSIQQSLAAGIVGNPPAPDQPAPDQSELLQRVAQLEALLNDLATEIPTDTMADVKAEMAEILAQSATLQAAFDSAQARLAALETLPDAIAGLQAQVAAIDLQGATLLLAAGRLSAVLATARPFAAELRTLQDAAADPALKSAIETAMAGLAPRAALGIPTLSDLQTSFPAMAETALRASQGDAAAGAVGAEPGWWSDLVAGLSDLITIRPVGEAAEGNSDAARLARAEMAMAAGDLAAAIAELDALDAAAAPAASDWLTGAKARAAVPTAIEALENVALARLQSGAGADADGTSP